jgi:hypothetical protein
LLASGRQPFTLAVVIVGCIIVGATVVGMSDPNGIGMMFYTTILGGYYLHAFVHLGQSLVLREYTPGLVTVVLLVIPTFLYLYWRLLARAIQLDYSKRWLLVALLLPPAIVGGALAVAAATDTTPTFPWAGQPVILPIAFVWILLLGGPVQEEFGWRGYLLDPLQDRLTPVGGGLAVGLVWAVWHLPLFYIPSETIYYQNPILGFVVSITLLSVLMTWVYNITSGSLLPALLMHTSWNWAQGMFPILESDQASLTMVGLLILATIVVVMYSGPRRLGRIAAVDRTE